MGMFKNYMKIGWRSILKQKVPSMINIFGLSCAIACCLVAYLFVKSVWFRGIHHEANPNYKYSGLQLEPFSTIVQNAKEIKGGLVEYNLASLILLVAIAIFMLSLTVFNYINTYGKETL